jgi:hypothetical protein
MTVLVDSTGRPEPATARVTATTSPEFAAALIGSLASARFRPAELDGRRVRQVVRYDRGVLVYRMNRLSAAENAADSRRQSVPRDPPSSMVTIEPRCGDCQA